MQLADDGFIVGGVAEENAEFTGFGQGVPPGERMDEIISFG
jgi:hypothetical protein